MTTQTLIFFFFLITFLFISITSSSSSSTKLSKGTSLHVEDAKNIFLISPNKTFTCGFYTFNETTNAYYFSIWYTNSIEKTVVWTANRIKPVNGHGSRLTLRKDGVLVLSDFDGSLVWQTNTTSSNTVDRAELLESGNLVLKDKSGHVHWQSFAFPTDTLLPTQHLTKNVKLVSRKSSKDFDFGYYSLFFDNDNVLKLMFDSPEVSSIYWPDPDPKTTIYDKGRTTYNSSRVASFDEEGVFISSDFLQFRASDLGLGFKRRLTIDYDGNLRMYSMNNSLGLWEVTWQAMVKQCNVHGLCGKNGICVYSPKPRCSCPPNFEPVDWSDSGKGCKPKFITHYCINSSSRFLEIPHVDFYGYDLNSTSNITFEKCRQLCLGDCRCQAFNYKYISKGSPGSRRCYIKDTLFNGHRAMVDSIHVRMPKTTIQMTLEPPKVVLNVSRLNCGGHEPRIVPLPNTNSYGVSKGNFNWVYLYSFIGVVGVMEAIVFVASWCFLLRKHGISASLEEGYRTISSQCRSFGYSELKIATNKFKQVIGKGGFGAVYKGVLADARVVAVKKLENIVQGEEEFLAEVSTFGKINHMNIARMWGFCSQAMHRLLVYEYIENGSLDKHLFSSSSSSNNNSSVLEWGKRYKIALGTAKGLAYLHHECLEWVIHCDVKPENILLDNDFEPKISDFGLAKLCQRSDHQGLLEMSKIRGTKGYMAPEWTTNLPLTAKVDVYSFGVVILELVRGIRLSSYMMMDDNNVVDDEVMRPGLKGFTRLVKGMMMEGGEEYSWIANVVDPQLEGNYSKNQAAKLIEIGLSCVEYDRNKRPTMEFVLQALVECEDETT